MRRIDRYALSEMIVPALVGVVILLILLLGNWLYVLLRYALVDGAASRDILLLLWYRLPGLLLQALPGSLLLGTALALNRLERDRELMSLRLAGVRLLRLVLPFILLGLLCAGFLFILQEFVINKSTLEAEKLQRKLMMLSPTTVVQPDVMFKVGSDTYLYAKTVDMSKKLLSGVIVMRVEATGRTWMVIPEAENQDGRWIFHRDPYTGTPPMIYYFTTQGDLKMSRVMIVDGVDEAQSWLDIKENRSLWAYMVDQPATPDAMTLRELLTMRYGGIRGPQLGSFGFYLDPQKMDFYIHNKISIPLSALVAVLIAIPFSVRFGRSGGYVGLLLSVLLSFFFVISQQWAKVLVESPTTHFSPILAAWLPDIVFGLLGLGLLLKEE